MTLKELCKQDIDKWVEAVSKIDDDPYLMGLVIAEAEDDEIRQWVEYGRCPAELERAINVIAEKKSIQFDKNLNMTYNK